MYCGEMVSRNSEPAGMPRRLTLSSRSRATRRPSLMRKLSSRYGSLIRPFQPTVVRGFSKYTRMTISRSAANRSRSGNKRRAYSTAASGSWIEHGPMITSRRSDLRRRMSCTACRVRLIRPSAGVSCTGKNRIRCSGGGSGTTLVMRSSSVLEVLSTAMGSGILSRWGAVMTAGPCYGVLVMRKSGSEREMR